MGLDIQSTLENGIAQTTHEFKVPLLRPIAPETGPIAAEGVVLNANKMVPSEGCKRAYVLRMDDPRQLSTPASVRSLNSLILATVAYLLGALPNDRDDSSA
jgi:hypothetical protein